jgi:hypothetical protein
MNIFHTKVVGAIETEKFLDEVRKQLMPKLKLGFADYVTKYLIPRIKKRLGNAERPHQSTPGPTGIINKAGGYGVPKNNPRYADWKSSRTNLPMVGDEPARTMIATGYLLDSVSLLSLKDTAAGWIANVGSLNMLRPVAEPFTGEPGSGKAIVDQRQIRNLELWQILEEKKYKVWAIEYEDVRRDAEKLAVRLIVQTILKLADEFAKKVA